MTSVPLSELLAFMNVDRRYDEAVKTYHFRCPEHFNFAYDIIDQVAETADKTAVLAVSSDGETVKPLAYSDLARRSNRFANGLAQLGVRPGDVACLIAGRIPAWYDAIFGCMKRGVVSMPGTTLLTQRDIAYRINYAGASIAIVTPEHCEKIEEIEADCPSLSHKIVLGAERPGWTSSDVLCAAMPDEIGPTDRIVTRSSDPMMAYFTSGTTALPKMVPRDHAYALAHASTALFWMDLRADDIHWTLTDTGWAKAAWGLLFPQFLAGCTVVLLDGRGGRGFNADLHLRLIERLKVTTFCAPPTLFRGFAQMDLSPYDLSSLRRSMGSGEPLNPEAIRSWHQQTGTVIADGYGQTETVNIIANYPDKPIKIGSMGLAVPGFDIHVVDEEGEAVADGELGTIALRLTDPPPPGLFPGYQTDAGYDRKPFQNGWYYTGDTARRDADGYFWFVGRADDLIVSAGYRISPFEVESALLEHEAVAESAVTGEPDALRGQSVVAHIKLADGFEATEDLVRDIQDFCKTQTAPYKYPRRIVFVDDLPKTISGKIRRVELREQAKRD